MDPKAFNRTIVELKPGHFNFGERIFRFLLIEPLWN